MVSCQDQAALHLQRGGAMRGFLQPAGLALAVQLGHLGAVEGEVGLAPAAGGGGAEQHGGERQQRRHGHEAEQRPEQVPGHSGVPPASFANRARSLEDNSGTASGSRRRRMPRISSSPPSSATAGVAQRSAVESLMGGRSSTKSP